MKADDRGGLSSFSKEKGGRKHKIEIPKRGKGMMVGKS